VEYAKNGWLLGFQYQGSFFVDDYSTLTWDNPLNTSGVGSKCVDSTIFTPTSLTGPCQGRASMYPNNQAHNFIVNGAGQLPFNTHVMGSLEYGFWLQNAPFIPLTSNSKLQQSLSSGQPRVRILASERSLHPAYEQQQAAAVIKFGRSAQ